MIPFLETLATILLVYFVLRFLIKLLMPYLVRFITKIAEKKMQDMFKGFANTNTTQETKETSNVSKKSSKVVGEYIDFEEID